MAKFEKKYVHFMWSKELEGKEVFYSDEICYLENNVIGNVNRGVVVGHGFQLKPFEVKDGDKESLWRFVYYDPYFQVKLAFEQGR